MRIRPGTPIEEVHQSLNASQKRHVEAVLYARAEEPKRLREVQNYAWQRVRSALEAGVPARLLAARLGVSPARVYQMREEAVEFEAAKNAASGEGES